MMIGRHILKHTFALSDEEICARWVENPYFQYFCGETIRSMRHSQVLAITSDFFSATSGNFCSLFYPSSLEEILFSES